MFGRYNIGKNGLFILRKDDIEDETENILYKYCPKCLEEPTEVNVEKLIEDMGLNLCYAKMSENSEILGAFVFNKGLLPIYVDDNIENRIFSEKSIVIDSEIADAEDPRLRFTYGHELGHYVTQYDIFHVNNDQLSLFEVIDDKETAVICKRERIDQEYESNERKKLETKEDWKEWQANYFSSSLLIPKCTLKIALKEYLDNYDVMDQTPVLNKLGNNELNTIIEDLSKKYNVSIEMMKNRLKTLKFLN